VDPVGRVTTPPIADHRPARRSAHCCRRGSARRCCRWTGDHRLRACQDSAQPRRNSMNSSVFMPLNSLALALPRTFWNAARIGESAPFSGRMTTSPLELTTNSTSLCGNSPAFSRTACGMVTWPLLVIFMALSLLLTGKNLTTTPAGGPTESGRPHRVRVTVGQPVRKPCSGGGSIVEGVGENPVLDRVEGIERIDPARPLHVVRKSRGRNAAADLGRRGQGNRGIAEHLLDTGGIATQVGIG